jgi:LPS-assembly protein
MLREPVCLSDSLMRGLHSAVPPLCLLLLPLFVRPAAAQIIPNWDARQFRLERLDADRLKLVGQVEIEGIGSNEGTKIFADDVEWNVTTGEASASGNVLVSTPTSRISAERAVLNTKTKLGTFYTASGIASLGERGEEDRTMFGSLEPEVYFYGETIEKIAEDKYRIHRGGFTTCVQPTPRWEVVSNSATINLGDYAILRNAVLRVKDVPVFYMPMIYYPIQEDDRATGFLMPSYGNSTYAGQSLSNAFFWAIDRSQDATLFHDWFFSRGQAVGGEYRYMAAPGSEGSFSTNWLNQQAGTVSGVTDPARRSYQMDGSVVQRLPGGLSARGRVDYFSDVTTQQLYNQNIYEASLSQRTFDGSLSGAWKGLSVNGTYRRLEQFITPTYSVVNGNAPSVTANLSSRRLGQLPAYLSLNTDSGRVLYVERDESTGTVQERDRSLGRYDISPSLRSPLLSRAYMTLTGTVGYRVTYYTESLNAAGVQVPEALTRNYGEFRAELVGPVFSRVFNPNNSFADRVKHLIEPSVSIQRRTSIDDFDRVPQVGLFYDTVFGGVTQVNYGLTNRLLLRKGDDGVAARAATAARPTSAPTEFVSVSLSQSYYSDERASQFDQQYQSGFQSGIRSNFSPVALTMRAVPTRLSTASLRLEYDNQESRLSSLSLQGGLNHPNAQVSAGWSRSEYRSFTNHNFNAGTTLRFADGRTGGAYTINWDIERSTIVQQRWTAFYSAQCCGFLVEYQEYNFANASALPVSKDRRFNFGVTLAGVGTFSNPFGTFGGGGLRY